MLKQLETIFVYQDFKKELKAEENPQFINMQ